MKPILFKTEMVRATLESRKTVTRRAVKPQPAERPALKMHSYDVWRLEWWDVNEFHSIKVPYRPGDILYVRETWAQMRCFDCPSEYCETNIDRSGLTISCDDGAYIYKATDLVNTPNKWRPSIHMPREAARIFLRVTDVRVERLRSITGDELKKEGLEFNPLHAKESFLKFAFLWDKTIKLADRAIYGWDANPWVWAIEFKRCEKPKGENYD